MTIAQSLIAKGSNKHEAPAERKIMFTIERLVWGSEKARAFQRSLSNRPIAHKRLSVLLKNPTYQIFGLVNTNRYPVAYYAVMLMNDNNSMIVHHAEAIAPNTLTTETTMLLLDHTGCDHAMGIGEDDDMVARFERMGFKLVENNWTHNVKPYESLDIDPRISDISGLENLTEIQMENLTNLIRQGLWEEGRTDPLERSIFHEVMPEDVIERATNNQWRTFAWFEDGQPVGIAQLQYTEWGEAVLSGVAVTDEHKGKRIGRNLMAAVCKYAARSHEYILSSTFSNNVPMEHLLGNVFKWRRLVGSYGVTIDKEAVSWKRTKHAGSNAGHGQPVYTGK